MAEHRGVSAAEKYAELEAAGALRPRCSCHGLNMKWQRNGDCLIGGLWKCVEKSREASRRWHGANLEKIHESARHWRETNSAKEGERKRRWRKANTHKIAAYNATRLYAGGMYLGTCGFNQTEVEMMLSGTSE